MILKKWNEQVWLTEVALDGYGVRGAMIRGEEGVLLLDTLSHPRDMTPLLPLVRDRGLTIVYTHGDWDHIWGTRELAWEDARIIGHDACLERFKTDVPITLHEKQLAEPDRWDRVQLIPPNETFQNEISLDLGSLSVSLDHLPGHTPDSIVLFLAEYGILFMGDTVETPFPCLEKKSPLSKWIAGLQRWERDPRVQTVIPAHGEIGDRTIIRQNIRYLQALLKGNEPLAVDPMTDFYRETHGANIRFARDAATNIQ